MRNSERGASHVPLVFCIVLLLGAAAWGWNEHGERESLRATLADIRSAAKTEGSSAAPSDDKIKSLIRAGLTGPAEALRLQDNAKVFGYVDDAEGGVMGSNPAKAREALDKFLAALSTGEFVRKVPAVDYVDSGNNELKIVRSDRGPVEIHYTGKAGVRNMSATFEEVLETMVVPTMRNMMKDITTLETIARQHKEAKEATETQARSDLSAKDAVISQKTSELSSLDAEKNRQTSELKQERDDAQAARAAAESAAAAARAELEAQVKILTRELQQAKESVQVLKERKRALTTDTSPDGTITGVGTGQSTIVIDLGKADNLLPGTNFEVYGYAKGNREYYKGSIKVVMVGDETSQAAVLDVSDALDPIVAGDRIKSLTYDPKHQMRFALAGRFMKMGRSDAALRLKSLGCAVDEKVGLDTDYLVIGAPESDDQPIEETEAFKAAKLYGITVITENELSRFTRY